VDRGEGDDTILKLDIRLNLSLQKRLLRRGEDCLYFINTYSGHLATGMKLLNKLNYDVCKVGGI
jgi:hypothetical protein